MKTSNCTVLSLLSMLSPATLCAQAATSDPVAGSAERVVVRAVLPAGERAFLLVSPTRTAVHRLPGTTLDLAVDPAGWTLLPLSAPGPRGARETTLTLPAEVDLAQAGSYAQVVAVSARGMRALPVFRLASGDHRVAPVAAPAVVAEGLDAPAGAEPAGSERDRAVLVSRNPALRVTVFTVDGRPLSGRASAEADGWTTEVVGPVETLAPAMSGLSLVSSPELYPSRVHGRIIINWPDGSTGQGSGTLIDSKHVITAGHVVYQSAKGGWATTLTFVPGYDNGTKPYGSGVSASGLGWRHSWTNWTVDGDNTHDVAYFQIDRPVGALTGWHGYGYSTACDFYLTTTFYTRSYPGESPYTGQLMYQRSGTFDSCPTEREARFDLYSYKGESGAGYYYLNANGNRYVRAVGSHRNSNPTSADRVRLTESKFDNIVDTLADAKASSVDFTPLGVVIDAASTPHVTAGHALPNLDFVAHNDSTAAFSGTLSWTVRLSSDKTITTGDTLLRTTSSTFGLGAGGSITIDHTNPPTIPATVAPGTYYVGIILTTADANAGNQVTLADDVAKVIVD